MGPNLEELVQNPENEGFDLQMHMICSLWLNEVVHHVRTQMQYL